MPAMLDDPSLSEVDLAALRRWDGHWRVIQPGDDRGAVWSLHQGGWLDRLKRRVPLYRLSEKGRALLPEGHEARVTATAPAHSTSDVSGMCTG